MQNIARLHQVRKTVQRTLARRGPDAAGRLRSSSGVLLLVSSLFLGLLWGCGAASTPRADSAPSATPVAVVKAVRHNLASQIEIASEFLPYQEIDVYAKVSGYIQKLYVDWGTHVRTGQVLADLEIPELQQQLQQDEATVHRGESDLERSREELNRATSEYNVAHLTYYAACRRAENAAGAGGSAGHRRRRKARTWKPAPDVSAAKDALAGVRAGADGRQGRARERQGAVMRTRTSPLLSTAW